MTKKICSSKDLAIIIPTKDRPISIRNHLQSLVDQNCELGRVIVVSSGQDIEEIVLQFKDTLPVEYYKSEPGQIRQRNLGISQLDQTTKLVATMDDDVIYFENAIKEMINLWNNTEGEIAGVGFNVVDQTDSIKPLFFSKTSNFEKNQGKVYKSGRCMPFSNLKSNIKVQWLKGGATVWQQKILLNHYNEPIPLDWAVCEDLIFSYPIGKVYPLMACAKAKVKLVDDIITKKSAKYYFNRAKTICTMRQYFLKMNIDLVRIYFLFDQLLIINVFLIKSIIYLKARYIYLVFGTLWALVSNLDILFSNSDPIRLINRLKNS